jgi:hypothetical protein
MIVGVRTNKDETELTLLIALWSSKLKLCSRGSGKLVNATLGGDCRMKVLGQTRSASSMNRGVNGPFNRSRQAMHSKVFRAEYRIAPPVNNSARTQPVVKASTPVSHFRPDQFQLVRIS